MTYIHTVLNQRIQVVKLNLEVPSIIINVYFPSSSLPQQEYDDSLNFLAATLSNHEAEAAIFVIGDFNRSLFRNNPGDQKFQNFCQTVAFSQHQEQIKMPHNMGIMVHQAKSIML